MPGSLEEVRNKITALKHVMEENAQKLQSMELLEVQLSEFYGVTPTGSIKLSKPKRVGDYSKARPPRGYRDYQVLNSCDMDHGRTSFGRLKYTLIISMKDEWGLTEGALYQCMKSLGVSGYLTWDGNRGGNYTLTDAGKEHLAKLRMKFSEMGKKLTGSQPEVAS